MPRHRYHNIQRWLKSERGVLYSFSITSIAWLMWCGDLNILLSPFTSVCLSTDQKLLEPITDWAASSHYSKPSTQRWYDSQNWSYLMKLFQLSVPLCTPPPNTHTQTPDWSAKNGILCQMAPEPNVKLDQKYSLLWKLQQLISFSSDCSDGVGKLFLLPWICNFLLSVCGVLSVVWRRPCAAFLHVNTFTCHARVHQRFHVLMRAQSTRMNAHSSVSGCFSTHILMCFN